jgi:hypothetical protein
VGQIAAGAFQPENYLGAIPEGKEKFLFKSFPNLLHFGGDSFGAKLQWGGYLERRNQGGEMGGFEGFTITG